MHGFRKVRHELAVVGFVVIIVVMFSSMAMHQFEHDEQPEKFGSLADSMWWSFVTLTTVGYGDLYPVTLGGRLVAVVTMILGIGIFGTFISLIGSSFLSTMREQRENEAPQLRVTGHPNPPAPHAPWIHAQTPRSEAG
jgi:voltage-gated potassium channel